MPDGTVLEDFAETYVYDGSYDGLFTAIFDAVYSRSRPADIVSQDRLQLTFATRFIEVCTDRSEAAGDVDGWRESSADYLLLDSGAGTGRAFAWRSVSSLPMKISHSMSSSTAAQTSRSWR